MNINQNPIDPSDEFLGAALSVARDRSIPDGPSEQLMSRTIASLKEAEQHKPSFFSRFNNMKFITSMAASVLLGLGLIVGVSILLRSPGITCAEVIDKVRSAHALAYSMTTGVSGEGKLIHMKLLGNDQGQMSMQTDQGMRMVIDTKTGQMLMVEPISKTAMVMDMKNMPKRSHQPNDFIEDFKKLEGKDAKDLGETEIDGKKAEKFAATRDQQDYVIWADRQTRDPIRVEVSVVVSEKTVKVTMTDFDFNPIVPDDAFTLDIPKGYSMQRISLNLADADNGEKNVTDLLKGFAARSGGNFPAHLDDMADYIKLVAKTGTTRPSDADVMWFVQYQFVHKFLGKLPKDQWKYLGDGKTLGDKNSLIFWYKSAKGYRGIYGDLSEADLPGKPQ